MRTAGWNGVGLPYLDERECASVRREVRETMTNLREGLGPDRASRRVPVRAVASVVLDALMRAVDVRRAALILSAAFFGTHGEDDLEWARLRRVEDIVDNILRDCWIDGVR